MDILIVMGIVVAACAGYCLWCLVDINRINRRGDDE